MKKETVRSSQNDTRTIPRFAEGGVDINFLCLVGLPTFGLLGDGALRDELGEGLPLDGRPWLIVDVILTELDRPFDQSFGALGLVEYDLQRLVRDYLNRMRLNIGTELPRP